jgi:outer membrane protein OmpA-like peptidoglycan-associated protein
MNSLSSIGLLGACATATALAAPDPSQHLRVGQLAELAFASGSAELALDADGKIAEQLDAAITWAHDHPDGLIVLDGHADPTGPRLFNVRLSLRRAKAVRAHLVAGGIDPVQIVIAAFGDDGPRHDRSVVIWGTRAGTEADQSASASATTWPNRRIPSAINAGG